MEEFRRENVSGRSREEDLRRTCICNCRYRGPQIVGERGWGACSWQYHTVYYGTKMRIRVAGRLSSVPYRVVSNCRH